MERELGKQSIQTRQSAVKEALSALSHYREELAMMGVTDDQQRSAGRSCGMVNADDARRCIASAEAEISGEVAKRQQRLH